MSVDTLVFLVFNDYAVERVRHVEADVGIIVFVQREGTGCVLDEEVENSDLKQSINIELGFRYGEWR